MKMVPLENALSLWKRSEEMGKKKKLKRGSGESFQGGRTLGQTSRAHIDF